MGKDFGATQRSSEGGYNWETPLFPLSQILTRQQAALAVFVLQSKS
jgi:hypothetical protein